MARISAHSLDELQGFMELGMKRESLEVARTLLKAPSITAAKFWQAVHAVLLQADRLTPWRRLIELAFVRLSVADQKRSSRKQFHFYVAISDWKAARQFLPKLSNDPMDLLFSMWTLLELREMEQARRVYSRCRRIWRSCVPSDFSDEDTEFLASTLTEAMAAYLAQGGEWRQAQELWIIGQGLWPFAANAWDSLAKLLACER